MENASRMTGKGDKAQYNTATSLNGGGRAQFHNHKGMQREESGRQWVGCAVQPRCVDIGVQRPVNPVKACGALDNAAIGFGAERVFIIACAEYSGVL